MKAPKISYTAASIVLRDTYESMYGIFDHNNTSVIKPLALVARQPAEDVYTHSRLYNTIKRFIEHDIGGSLNCSLTEFLNMPREYTMLVMEILTERRNRKNSSAADVERRMREEFRGL